MNFITKAINENMHLCENKDLAAQRWSQFEEQSKGKKIFVFGVGYGMDYFLRNCCDNIEIYGVLDNDRHKQHQKLGWYCSEAWQTEYENIIIQEPDILNTYKPQDIVVLITSANYYQSIIEQLQQEGIDNVFLLLMMEVNKRKELNWEEMMEEDTDKLAYDYAKWCCQQEIESNKIVMSYGEYGGHAKYITKQLLRLRNDLDIVWLVYEPQMEAPEGVRLVFKNNMKRYIYEMETAKIWLNDVTVHKYIIKRQNQIYIQTKHWSSITLKKFGLDDKSSCVSAEIESLVKRNGEMMDYLFSGSEFDEETYRSGYAFQGKAVRIGSARSDILFDKYVKQKVYSKFCLKPETQVLLYVPTYRHKEYIENRSMKVSLDFNGLLDVLRQKYGGEWYLFVRLHPRISFEKSGIKESKWIINAGNYPDSEELVAASDIMVTDYSSIMFEGAFVKKPIFLYAPDKEEYIDGERGLWLDYDSLPFPIAETNDKLRHVIMDFDRRKYEEDVTNFLDRYGVHEDGHASERAAQFILDLLE